MSPEKPSTGARVTATRLPSGETAGSQRSCPGSAATTRSQGKSELDASRQICCSYGESSAASSRSNRPASQLVVAVGSPLGESQPVGTGRSQLSP